MQIALFLFVFAVVTDKLDGTLARITKQETDFGKNLDGAADAALIVLAYIGFLITGMLPLVFMIILGLGVVIIAIATVRYSIKKGRLSHPSWRQGKVATVLAYCLAIYLLIGFGNTWVIWFCGIIYLLLMSYYIVKL